MHGATVGLEHHGRWVSGTVLWEYSDNGRKRALVRVDVGRRASSSASSTGTTSCSGSAGSSSYRCYRSTIGPTMSAHVNEPTPSMTVRGRTAPGVPTLRLASPV